MTPQEWEKVEASMKGVFGHVKLEVDGYNISINKNIQKDKFIYTVYIDGGLKGEWFFSDNPLHVEIRQRFYREVIVRLYSNKKKEYILSDLTSKKKRAEMTGKLGLDKTFSNWHVSFPSFKALKAKLIKNNKSIKLIEL